VEEEVIQKSFLHKVIKNFLISIPHYTQKTHNKLIVINNPPPPPPTFGFCPWILEIWMHKMYILKTTTTCSIHSLHPKYVIDLWLFVVVVIPIVNLHIPYIML
jgi:hypothetical protein